MLEQVTLMQALPWGTEFEVALDCEWNIISHPEYPNRPYMKEDHVPELLNRHPDFAGYLEAECGKDNLFVKVSSDVSLRTFYDYLETFY